MQLHLRWLWWESLHNFFKSMPVRKKRLNFSFWGGTIPFQLVLRCTLDLQLNHLKKKKKKVYLTQPVGYTPQRAMHLSNQTAFSNQWVSQVKLPSAPSILLLSPCSAQCLFSCSSMVLPHCLLFSSPPLSSASATSCMIFFFFLHEF